MRCPICDATAGFSEVEYTISREMFDLHAPALECRACRAILLQEVAARTQMELAAVRLAQAVRRSIVGAPDALSDRGCACDWSVGPR
jgi:hypothetical protein